MTALQKRIHRRYCRIEKHGNKWACRVVIDHQSFLIHGNTTRQTARWFGRMTAIALARLVEHEAKGTP